MCRFQSNILNFTQSLKFTHDSKRVLKPAFPYGSTLKILVKLVYSPGYVIDCQTIQRDELRVHFYLNLPLDSPGDLRRTNSLDLFKARLDQFLGEIFELKQRPLTGDSQDHDGFALRIQRNNGRVLG